jgi:hypothetical protein
MGSSASGMKKRFGLILTGLLVSLTTGVTLLSSVGCVPRSEWAPGHSVSPYGLGLTFPEGSYINGQVYATPGETLLLKAGIVSHVDVPIAVKVVRADTLMVCSEYITFRTDSDEYITIGPSGNITLDVYCTIAANAPTGVQKTALRCQMEKSISGMAGSGLAFDVYIK